MNPWERIDDTDVYDGFPISSYRIEQFLYGFWWHAETTG